MNKSDEYSNFLTAYSTSQTCIMILISYRPSDKRSPRKDLRLQYAFENQVLGVSCISHRLTQLAAFFIDQRTEWSTVCSCNHIQFQYIDIRTSRTAQVLKLKGTKYLLMSALPPIKIKSSNRYSERLHSDTVRDRSETRVNIYQLPHCLTLTKRVLS